MRAAMLSLLLALPLFAEYNAHYRFEPPAPTDHTGVVLQVREVWRDGCVPYNPKVTRSGNAFTILFATTKGVACPAALRAWNADIFLGLLSAGTYTVTVQVDDFNGIVTRATLPLVVTEGAPALRIDPNLASTAGGSTIRFWDMGCTDATVIVDGVTVPTRVEGCTVAATLPAHAAGPVNVRVSNAAGTFDIVNGVHYVDPAAAPDPALYERVLLPVVFDGPGAFGSAWKTEIMARNYTQVPIDPIPEVGRLLPHIPPGAPLRLTGRLGNRPAGALLFIPRGADVRFGNHIRDVSREGAQWGTEIPVVRERDTTTDTIVFADVPFDPRYRLQLRIYGIDGVSTSATFNVGPNFHREVRLDAPCAAMPCNSNEPAYASFDLGQTFAGLSGNREVILRQIGLQPVRLFAFITVTNNETQHVTVIRAQ
jgi:hypothetical protein